MSSAHDSTHIQGRSVRSMFFECDFKKCISAPVDKNAVGLKTVAGVYGLFCIVLNDEHIFPLVCWKTFEQLKNIVL